MFGAISFGSIGTKIQVLAGAAFLSGLAGVLSYQTYTRIEAAREERLDANLRIVHGLSGPARGAIALRDKSAIRAYMELLSSDPRAAGLVITADSEVMESQQSIDHFELPIDGLSAFALQAEANGKTAVLDIGDYEFIAVPIKNPANRAIGSIAVAWSIKGLLDNVWETAIKEALALIAVVALVLVVLVCSLRWFVTSPLKKIAALLDRLPAFGTGEAREAASEFENRADEIGAFARALGRFYRDAAERHHLHSQLDSALNNMSQGLCMFDKDGRLVVSNPRYAQMYGVSPGALKPGLTVRDIIQLKVDAGLFSGADSEAYVQQHLHWAAGNEPGTTAHQLNNGKTLTVSRQPTANGGWVVTHTDVTELRHAERQLSHLACHDVLTSLPNRRRFKECIDEALHQKQPEHGLALHFLDLDRFKAVNDTLGHAAGDELLKMVAARLLECVEPRDTVCRLGGDEFAILQLSARRPEDAEALAVRITQSLSAPFDIGGHEVKIGVSAGIAMSPGDGEDAGTLLKNADLAVYQAKAEGRNTHRFYTVQMSDRQRQRQKLELQMRTALEAKQFELHYQPIVNLLTGRISCLEALVRWRHPELGMVSPADFIPIAEETGLIVPIGEWIIREACLEATKWPPNIRLAVNISAVQFQRGDLALTVFGALAASRLAAGRLELEITESVLLGDDDTTTDLLHKLRGFGVRIAMDDFGTGYSALSYLNKFPFDKIKIDRSFIGDIAENKANSAIVDAVSTLCRSLGIATVAEGVETESQRRHLLAAGITEMQGYLFSPPRSGHEIHRRFFSASWQEEDVRVSA